MCPHYTPAQTSLYIYSTCQELMGKPLGLIGKYCWSQHFLLVKKLLTPLPVFKNHHMELTEVLNTLYWLWTSLFLFCISLKVAKIIIAFFVINKNTLGEQSTYWITIENLSHDFPFCVSLQRISPSLTFHVTFYNR